VAQEEDSLPEWRQLLVVLVVLELELELVLVLALVGELGLNVWLFSLLRRK
jgi:nitrate reductase NapE component